eukprot:365894-Chlamydomonas_euryale.AAC.6
MTRRRRQRCIQSRAAAGAAACGGGAVVTATTAAGYAGHVLRHRKHPGLELLVYCELDCAVARLLRARGWRGILHDAGQKPYMSRCRGGWGRSVWARTSA